MKTHNFKSKNLWYSCSLQIAAGASVFFLFSSLIDWLPGNAFLPELFTWSFPLLLSTSSLLISLILTDLPQKLRCQLSLIDTTLWLTSIAGVLLLLTTSSNTEGKTCLAVCFLSVFTLKTALIGYALYRSQQIRTIKPCLVFLAALWFFGFHGSWQWPANSLQGDEPHYLMMTHSMVRDTDLNLFNEYREQAYSGYYSGILEPKPSDFQSRGLIFSRGLGASFPLLLVPSYALNGYSGSQFFMILCAALMLLQLYLLLLKEINNPVSVLLSVFIIGSTIPVLTYSSLIYPDIVAALLIVSALRLLQIPPLTHHGRSVPALLVLICGILIFLKFRYFVPISLILFPLLIRESRRKGKMLILVLTITVFGSLYFLVDTYFLAGDLFSNRFGHIQSIIHFLPDWNSLKIVPGLLFDQESGFLIYAPVYLLCISGIKIYTNKKTPVYWFALLGVPFTIISLLGHFAWHCLPTPPLRYLLPVLPPTALFLATVLTSWKKRSVLFQFITVLWITLSWIVAWISSINPDLLTNLADGSAEILTQTGKAVSLPLAMFFPSLIRPGVLLWIWIPVLLFLLAILLIQKLRDASNKPTSMTPALALLTSISLLAVSGILASNLKISTYHAEDVWWSSHTSGTYYPENRDPFFHQETRYGWKFSPDSTMETPLMIITGDYSIVLACKLTDNRASQKVQIYQNNKLLGRIKVTSPDWTNYGFRTQNLSSKYPLIIQACEKNSAAFALDAVHLYHVSDKRFQLWEILAGLSRKTGLYRLTCTFMTRAFLSAPGDPWFEMRKILPGAHASEPDTVKQNPIPHGFI
ncbi:hypothetical protein K8T06_07870, partial [bacterium]|nr:hypothetical protein [bacterium]